MPAQGLERFRVLADGLDHPEGVAVGPAGQIYAGGEAGQLYRVGAAGSVEVIAETGGFLLGLAVDGDERVYACDRARSVVTRVDTVSGAVATYSRGTPATPLRTPNAAAFGRDGSLYITDSGTWDGDDGLVFRVAPDGRTKVWTGAVTSFPNGCCVLPDGSALLVVTSTPAPGVVAVPILSDGSAGSPETVVALKGTVPDGIAVTEDGMLLVCCYRPDRIYAVGRGGGVEVLADDPRGTLLAAPTNLAFAGERRERLVVANLARWHLAVADVGLRGAPVAYPHLP